MAKINIKGMKFYAFHGCFDEEKIVGTHFLVNCSIETAVTQATIDDDLTKTINYQDVYKLIAEQMKISSNLLEHVAGRIIKAIKETFAEVKHVEVEIRKLNPPLGGQINYVSVEMTDSDLYLNKNL